MDAAEKCNGAGACRKSAGNGVMCPSYQATREENNSTRGRANLLRYALTEPDPRKALNNAELQQALEMCLGCKACKTECPANVDMARLKSEVLFQTRKGRISLSDFVLKYYATLLKVGQKMPRLFNGLQSLSVVKWAFGVDQRRRLPLAHVDNLQSWWQDQFSENLNVSSKGESKSDSLGIM
jgi:Fe-S oxidoreductase